MPGQMFWQWPSLGEYQPVVTDSPSPCFFAQVDGCCRSAPEKPQNTARDTIQYPHPTIKGGGDNFVIAIQFFLNRLRLR